MQIIGAGFHPDTRARDYVTGEQRTLSRVEQQNLDSGIGQAIRIVGRQRVDDVTLDAVYACLGVGFDPLNQEVVQLPDLPRGAPLL